MKAKQRIINEFKGEGREVIDWTLYDSQYIATASAVNRLTFFQNTVGGVGRARTNMVNAGLMPSPEQFLVEEIYCLFVNDDGGALVYDKTNSVHPINVFLSQGFWDFTIEPAVKYQGHLSELVFPFEENSMQDDNTPDTIIFGEGHEYARLYLRKPFVLGSARHFELTCTLTAPAAGNGYAIDDTLMYWFLKGWKRRNK